MRNFCPKQIPRQFALLLAILLTFCHCGGGYEERFLAYRNAELVRVSGMPGGSLSVGNGNSIVLFYYRWGEPRWFLTWTSDRFNRKYVYVSIPKEMMKTGATYSLPDKRITVLADTSGMCVRLDEDPWKKYYEGSVSILRHDNEEIEAQVNISYDDDNFSRKCRFRFVRADGK